MRGAAEGRPAAMAALAAAPHRLSSPALERQLVVISPRQIERRLQTRKQTLKRKPMGPRGPARCSST